MRNLVKDNFYCRFLIKMMFTIRVLGYFSFSIIFFTSTELAFGFTVMNDTGAMMYLEKFGYIEPEDMSFKMGMKQAQPMLMAFQKMCNINQTGKLDSKTMEMMNAPRCGNKDMVRVPLDDSNEVSSNRLRRFMINENNLKWKKQEVTYRMGMFSDEMQKHVSKEQVFEAIEKAFRLWSEACSLDFIHRPNEKEVDIELSFTSRQHPQDGFPFDGPGKVLAHAFAPGRGVSGDVHFEDEEDWRVHSPKGTDVHFVAVHEIGHALGLSHSSTKGAIMAAFYGGYKPHLKLHPDDIEGVQALYGKREAQSPKSRVFVPPSATTTTTTTTTTRRPTTRWTTTAPSPTPRTTAYVTDSFVPTYKPPKYWPDRPEFDGEVEGNSKQSIDRLRPDLCQDARVDAITTIGGNIYLFKGTYVFLLDNKGQGVVQGWPSHIGSVFPGLDTNIDAAATRDNGKTYFFKGKLYWRFTGRQMDSGYPKRISQHFEGIPEDLDAAFIYDGQFYFTKGQKYWRFNPRNKPHVNWNYPLPIESLGLSYSVTGIDAVMVAPHGEIYFFQDHVYYRFDLRTFKIYDAEPPYPRSSKVMWFGCTSNRPNIQNIRMPSPYSVIKFQ